VDLFLSSLWILPTTAGYAREVGLQNCLNRPVYSNSHLDVSQESESIFASPNSGAGAQRFWFLEEKRQIIGWFLEALHQVMKHSAILNSELNCTSCEAVVPLRPEFEFPAFVLSLPDRMDRRNHSKELLQALGFTNVFFPQLTTVKDLSPGGKRHDLVTHPSWIDPSFFKAISKTGCNTNTTALAYLARVVDQVDIMEEMIASEQSFFAIFEDDMLPVGNFTYTNKLISEALSSLPESADFLLLEMCLEDCGKTRVLDSPRLLKPHSPLCSGATIVTRKGALTLQELIRPAFSSIDNMLQILMEKDMVEAYVSNPVVFFQDGRWGSDASRENMRAFRSIHQLNQSANWQGFLSKTRHNIAISPCYEPWNSPYAGAGFPVPQDKLEYFLQINPGYKETMENFELESGFVRDSVLIVIPTPSLLQFAPPGKGPISISLISTWNSKDCGYVKDDGKHVICDVRPRIHDCYFKTRRCEVSVKRYISRNATSDHGLEQAASKDERKRMSENLAGEDKYDVHEMLVQIVLVEWL